LALNFLASDPERLQRFLALSGLDPAAIRQAAASPGFFGGVLQHILDDDRLAEAFAMEVGLRPEDLARIAMALGAHWERDIP
jgi:hypothetical protein